VVQKQRYFVVHVCSGIVCFAMKEKMMSCGVGVNS